MSAFVLTPDVAQRIRSLTTLERMETDERQRFRRRSGGDWLPSSTTILDAMAKGWAFDWSAKMERQLVAGVAGELFAELRGQKLRPESVAALVTARAGEPYAYERVRDAAGDIGHEAHSMIEWTVRRELGDTFTPEPTIGTPARAAFAAWGEWRQGCGFVSLAAEVDVYHEAAGYSGMLDYIGLDAEGIVVNDWKSGKAIYPSHHLQLASYITAVRSLGIPARTGFIIQLPKVDGDPPFKPVEVGHMAAGRVYTVEELFDVFMHVKQLWDWTHHKNKPAVTGRTAKKTVAALPAPVTDKGMKAAGNGAVGTADSRGTESLSAADAGASDVVKRLSAPCVKAPNTVDPSSVERSCHERSPMSEVETAQWRKKAHDMLTMAGISEARYVSERVREVLGLGEVYELAGPLSGEQWKLFCERFAEEQKKGGERCLAEAKRIGRKRSAAR